jgi:DNA-binding response OmpR family regulator
VDGWLVLGRLEPGRAPSVIALWTFVQRLRRKLGDDPRSPRVILSAGSRGYRLGI